MSSQTTTAKTTRVQKCQLCRENEAEWAMQYVACDAPMFSTLGSHYRGFRIVKVCDECKEERQVVEHELYGAMSDAGEGEFAPLAHTISRHTGVGVIRVLAILEQEENSR